MKLGIYLNAQHPAADDPARRFAEAVEQARLIRKEKLDRLAEWSKKLLPPISLELKSFLRQMKMEKKIPIMNGQC